jgi:methionine biosynthesis protein MetW
MNAIDPDRRLRDAREIRFVAKNMRVDLRMIAEVIAPGSRVLDIGCGDGTLIEHLFRTRGCDARGIEIDMAEVTRAVTHGLPVMHGDADTDLQHYPDNAFDYVVLSRTLQAVERPREVLRQMLRISTHALVSFPNFGHWLVRWQLLRTGRMPMTPAWDKPWYETPNIHPCTMHDFSHYVRRKAMRWNIGWQWTRRAAARRGAVRARSPICLASRHCSCCGAPEFLPRHNSYRQTGHARLPCER